MANVLIQCLNKKDAAPSISIGMAKGFADNNNQVCCLISDKIENLNEWLRDDRLNVTLIDTGSKRNFIKKSIKMLFITRNELKRKYEKINFDVSIQPFIHPWGAIINSAIKSKYKLGICHDPNPHSGEALINRLFAYIGYRSTKELIVLTKSFVAEVKERYKKPVYYMRLGLLTNNSIKQETFKPDGGINFLFFGRIEKYKGIGVLLKAYAKICNHTTNLTIAGSGDFSDYEGIINSCTNVNLINRYIRDSEIEGLFLRPNTVLVVPYLDATQSGVIPIAVDYEVPIIASDTGGLKEQLDDGNVGIFVKPGAVNELASVMEMFIDDSEKYLIHKLRVSEYKPLLEWKNITKELLDKLL